MPLDPALREFLDQVAASGRSFSSLEPAELRSMFELMSGLGTLPEHPVPAEDREIPGAAGPIPVRIYRPEADGPLPVVVYLHGGGFVIGSVATHNPLCQQIASGVPAVVVSVDYRLAPEHPFPAAVEDCVAATRWVAEHATELGADPSRLAVAGDSAGGNLTAVVSLRARDAGGPSIAFQLMIYPVTDMTGSMPSCEENGEGYLLTTESMEWFGQLYLGDRDRRQPDASPLLVEDLSGLPAAAIVTAEFDPLRDEGEAYGRRLQDAGVRTEVRRYDGMIHGFMQFDAIAPNAQGAVHDVVTILRDALVTAPV